MPKALPHELELLHAGAHACVVLGPGARDQFDAVRAAQQAASDSGLSREEREQRDPVGLVLLGLRALLKRLAEYGLRGFDDGEIYEEKARVGDRDVSVVAVIGRQACVVGGYIRAPNRTYFFVELIAEGTNSQNVDSASIARAAAFALDAHDQCLNAPLQERPGWF